MKIGFIGLGKMGSQIVVKLIAAGHEIVVFDPNTDALARMQDAGAVAAISRDDLVAQLGDKAVVWLMIPSDYVEDEIDALAAILPQESIIVDGGNSDYKLTVMRSSKCAEKGILLVDVGTSGGILGLENGFSMMVGGDKNAYEVIESLLGVLAAPRGGYAYFGKSGCGHYVKMVHNGIEYGMMQAYAEGYHLLRETSDYPGIDLAAVSKVWQQGSIIESGLNKLIAGILQNDQDLTGIDGFVADSGEGRWTLRSAQEQNILMPVLNDAIEVRVQSQAGKVSYATKLLAAMRNAFGGHAINK